MSPASTSSGRSSGRGANWHRRNQPGTSVRDRDVRTAERVLERSGVAPSGERVVVLASIVDTPAWKWEGNEWRGTASPKTSGFRTFRTLRKSRTGASKR